MDKKIIELKEFETLAKLPSLEELRAKIVGYITAPHQQLIGVLNRVIAFAITIPAFTPFPDTSDKVK